MNEMLTHEDMARLRNLRRRRFKCAEMVTFFASKGVDRDDISEMIDAQIRNPNDVKAAEHANRVIFQKANGILHINGNPVTSHFGTRMYQE